MKLTKLRVKNFRCIEDCEEFDVPQVACLVGKNEAGKSALLEALHRFNPHRAEIGFDLVRDYPRRHLATYEPTHAHEQATVLETTWELSADDIASLADVIGPAGSRKIKTVDIRMSYPLDKNGPGSRSIDLDISSEEVVRHLIDTSTLGAEDKENFVGVQTIIQLKAAIAAGDTPERQSLKARLETTFAAGEAKEAAAAVILSRLPKFVFFSQYDVLRGRTHLESLVQKTKTKAPLDSAEELFIDLCAFAGSSLDELAQIQSFEVLKARFEAAQNRITDQIFEYWTSNAHLSAEFSRDPGMPQDTTPFNAGNVFNLRIKNELHGNTVPFSERSSGFVWFFSFVVLFDQVRKRFGDNIILLLDEPGLNLHAQAQADLLRFIDEKLRPTFQVLYTTHSLFMVPPGDLLSVRIVEDVVVERAGRRKPAVLGTKVRSSVLEVAAESLFPLQGALGFEITQTLFVGKNTLMVEGPSDLLYLTAYSKTLHESGRISLDPRWTVCPVGGIDKVPAFLALFGQKLNVAVLVDLQRGAKGKVAQAEKFCSELRGKGRVFTYASFTGKTEESDVEDMLGSSGYVSLVNATYKPTPQLGEPDSRRVLEFVEAEMRTRGEFSHYGPAEHLLLNRSELIKALPESDLALQRFEMLFNALNGLLTSE